MAVTKRLRFEILRRDNHQCRYCGATAPEAVLTVDHVVAIALGGGDEPSNLVTACKDCNSGKSATPADASLVADVSADALRWSQAMDAVVARRLQDIAAEEAYVNAFLDKWNSYTYSQSGNVVPLPDDWSRTITHWYSLKLPIEILRNAAGKAMNKQGIRGYNGEFRYMAGVVWAVVREMQEQAQATLNVANTVQDPHCDSDPWCPVHADNADPCSMCGEVGCTWLCGFSAGRFFGAMKERRINYGAYAYEYLEMNCDAAVKEPFLVALDEADG